MWTRAKDTPFHFDSSLTMSYHRSLDGGRTWLPCYVEVEVEVEAEGENES